MDVTSSSFAVSSLCAATATCSAAAVGLTWATTREPDRSASSLSHNPETRPTTAVRRSTSKRSFLARPTSAVVSSARDNPWALTPGPSAGNRASHQSGTPVESLQEAEEAEDIAPESLALFPQRRASTWFRQRLTLTPSSGQSSQATDHPSTPSTYTNASNTPFIPSSAPPVNARNRLVKRSTSQKFPGHPGSESTPFRPTFRRPATSHQRNAEFQSRVVRHERSHSSAAHSVRFGRESSDSNRKSSGAWHWEPFFKKRVVRVKASTEPSLKAPADLFLGKKDELSCVRAPSGQLPTLVMAASITAQISLEPDFTTPAPLKTGHFQSYQHVTDPASHPAGRKLSQFREDFPDQMSSRAESEPRVSSSFSISNLIPSPSPAPFKIVRKRSSRKQDAASPSLVASRNVSDSRILTRSRVFRNQHYNEAGFDIRSNGSESDGSRLAHARSVSDVGAEYRSSQSGIGSSAEDSIVSPKLRETAVRGHRHSFSGGTEQSFAGVTPSSNSISNPRLSRGSRIASDHGSTVHGSDTDNSRVFSVNGDDYDTFSETNYDSFRTGGTNSSQSARRPTRIEGVFDELLRDGFHGDELSVLEEKLSDASLSGSPRHAADNNNSHEHSRDLLESEESGLDGSKISTHARLFSSSISPPSPTPQLMNRMSSPPFTMQDLHEDFDDALWDVPEEDIDLPIGSLQLVGGHSPEPPSFLASDASVTPDPQKKVNLWDWSEKQQDDDRPKTVHGKNPIDRSNRTGSRRPNVHARSQSVPNVGDNNKARFNDSAKLDAWTLGGKGASEDWDDDFDVDELAEEPEEIGSSSPRHSKDFRSSGFVVPDTILEKQNSVHYQFNHVKELSQLVEVLRRLRRIADELGIREGQSASLWVEAEGIIDLATLEEDEELAPPTTGRPSSPISDAFDLDEDERTSTPASAHQVVLAIRDDTPTRGSPRQHLRDANSSNASPSPITRPRQGSTVQAKTVLEHLHSHRANGRSVKAPVSETKVNTLLPSTPIRQTRTRKQPFDTQSLKDLVVRAGVVTRALQELVRQVEEQREIVPGTPQSHKRPGSSLGLTHDEATREPLFQLFQHPGPLSTPPSQRRSPLFKRDRESTPMTPSARESGPLKLALDSPNRNSRKHVSIVGDSPMNGNATGWS